MMIAQPASTPTVIARNGSCPTPGFQPRCSWNAIGYASKQRYRNPIHAKADEHEVGLKHICYAYLLRPFMMLVLEPILTLLGAEADFARPLLKERRCKGLGNDKKTDRTEGKRHDGCDVLSTRLASNTSATPTCCARS
jgi:hypothetical protein